jgi:hypothetical protein
LLGLFAAPPAAAQSAADKATARQLMIDGRDLRAAGDAQGALKKFKAADEIMHVPTTGLDLAKTHVLLNQLLEAQEALLAVRRYELKPKDPDAYRAAQAEAAQLEETIAPKIPSLVINVSGPPESAELVVTVDGEAVPRAVLSQPRKINPGKHAVLARAAGHEAAERAVEVKEGETKYVQIALTPAGGAAPAQDPWTKGPAAATGPDTAKGGVPAWAWIAGGVGVVGTGLAIGFGVDLAGVKSDIATQCPNGACPSDAVKSDLTSHYNRSLTLTVLFAAVGAKKVPSTAVLPWVGPGTGGALVTGRF